jgi:hypothetical protein
MDRYTGVDGSLSLSDAQNLAQFNREQDMIGGKDYPPENAAKSALAEYARRFNRVDNKQELDNLLQYVDYAFYEGTAENPQEIVIGIQMPAEAALLLYLTSGIVRFTPDFYNIQDRVRNQAALDYMYAHFKKNRSKYEREFGANIER